MDDNDPPVTITLKRSEWNCLVEGVGRALNGSNVSAFHQAFGHYVMDVWRKAKRQIREMTSP